MGLLRPRRDISRPTAAKAAAGTAPPGPAGRPPAPQPARSGLHLVEWSCEFAGTALLLLGGLSAVCLDFGRGSPVARAVPATGWRLLITGAMFAGSGLLVTVSPLGRRSGAHLNPAVTLGFFLRRHVHPHDLVGYVLAQCAGALAGAGLVRLLWAATATSVRVGLTRPGRGLSDPAAAAVEAGMTAALVLTIFLFVSSPRTARLTPVAVWALVTVLVWQVAPYTGTSLNPARSLGPAAVVGMFAHYPDYLIGPLLGAVAAVGLFALFGHRETLTAKLFHDRRYPTTMASRLPAHPPPAAVRRPPARGTG